MRNITKIKRSVRAISPVISVLLMIAIAVVAALIAYAWVMGYMGSQTGKAGTGIQLQSFTTQGNLVLYVQNTGQGIVHLKYDGAVYVNDVLKNILLVDDQNAKSLDPIPVAEGQTRTLVIDYVPQANEELRIKIVTMEGTFIEGSGKTGQQTSQVAVSINKVGGSAASTVSPASGNYYVGQVIQLQATVGAGDVFTSWTSSSQIHLYGDDSATTILAKINGAGSITGTFTTATSPRLDFTRGTGQSIFVDTLSAPITVKRQQDGAGSITVNLASTSSTGVFCDQSGNSIGNTINILNKGGEATFYYKDSNAGTYRLTASATGYTEDNTQITIKAPEAPKPTPTINPNPTTTPNPTDNPNPTETPTPTNTPTPTPTPTDNPEMVQVTFVVDPPAAGTTTGVNGTYAYGTILKNIAATPISQQYEFYQWSKTNGIALSTTTSSPTNITLLTSGTVTAHFREVNTNKLVFTPSSIDQYTERNLALKMTIQRQDAAGNLLKSGSLTVNLTTESAGGKFYKDKECTQEITSSSPLTIGNNAYEISFWYKDSNTGAPTITAKASGFQQAVTTCRVNLRYATFDGSDWTYGWSVGTQPPWFRAAGQGVGGTDAASANSTTSGPFTGLPLDTSAANKIAITFKFRVQNTESSDFKISWYASNNSRQPNLDTYSSDFRPNYISIGDPASLGLTPDSNGWYQYTLTLTKADNPNAFAKYFWFRFETAQYTYYDYSTGQTVTPLDSSEQVWVDNAIIWVE